LLKTILGLRKDDVFVDFGHGIGSVALQASYTVGCKARGIELIPARQQVAKLFQVEFEKHLSNRTAAIDKEWSRRFRNYHIKELGLPKFLYKCDNWYEETELYMSGLLELERHRHEANNTEVRYLNLPYAYPHVPNPSCRKYNFSFHRSAPCVVPQVGPARVP
jgi:hypothetical protein